MSRIKCIPSCAVSSRRPMKGEIYDAPAFAAKSACAAEKHSVTFTFVPSSRNFRVAFKPSSVSGHLTTTFGAILANSRPSRSIPSVSSAVTSAETSPLTMLQISAIRSLKSISPSFATSVGLVVTPSIMPSSFASLISSKFAVSIKNFIDFSLRYQAFLVKIQDKSNCRSGRRACPALNSSRSNDGVCQSSDPLDLDLANISGRHSRHARRRPRRDYVARI